MTTAPRANLLPLGVCVLSLLAAVAWTLARVLPRIDGSMSGDDYELHFNGFLFGRHDLEFRVHASDSYIAAEGNYAIGHLPLAQIPGLDPVPIEVRYVDGFGLPHHQFITFDVRDAASRPLRLFMYEGQDWVSYSSHVEPGKPVVVTFWAATDRCTIVHYGIDSDDVPYTLALGQKTIALDTVPKSVAVRFDLCNGAKEYQKVGPDGAPLVGKTRQ